MFTSAVAQTNFNAISQAPMNALFSASGALVKTALLSLMLTQVPTTRAQEQIQVDPEALLAQAPLVAEQAATLEADFKAASQAADVQAATAAVDDNGELWMGHYFDYATYPHGHFDCAHGSTVFDQYRSEDNENKRRIEFLEFGNCFRGIHAVEKVKADEVVVCNPNGQITRTATTRDL